MRQRQQRFLSVIGPNADAAFAIDVDLAEPPGEVTSELRTPLRHIPANAGFTKPESSRGGIGRFSFCIRRRRSNTHSWSSTSALHTRLEKGTFKVPTFHQVHKGLSVVGVARSSV